MTNLTEQWEKGELPSGRYWVKMSYQGAIIPLYYSEDYGFEYDDHFYDFEEISEVLAEVPSYEEWQDVKDDLATCDKDLNNVCEQKEELYEENEQLKELLKRSRKYLSEQDTPYKLIAKIDQVLGEE